MCISLPPQLRFYSLQMTYSCMYGEEEGYGKKPSGDECGNGEMGNEDALGKS